MATAQYLINNAMKALNILDAGETPSTDESNDALVRLNAMISAWNIQDTMATSAAVDSVTVLANAETATLATPYRRIVSASHVVSSNFIMPLEVVNAVQWNKIPDRGISGNVIRFLFYDRAASSPKIYVAPRPLANGSISFIAWAAQPTFATLSTDNTLLPGYEQALITGLAIELAGMFSVPVPDSVLKSNLEAMNEIRRLNASLMGLEALQAQPAAAPQA